MHTAAWRTPLFGLQDVDAYYYSAFNLLCNQFPSPLRIAQAPSQMNSYKHMYHSTGHGQFCEPLYPFCGVALHHLSCVVREL